MNEALKTVVEFAKSQLDLHKHLPGDSILGVVLKKQEWAAFVAAAEEMESLNAELLAALIEIAGYVPDFDTGGIGVTAEFTQIFEIARAAIARCEAGRECAK